MGFISAIQRTNWKNVARLVTAFIPYVDSEIMGVIPVLRDLLPWVTPIYVTRLSWTERGRLLVLMIVPYVDGEIIELLGWEIEDVIADP